MTRQQNVLLGIAIGAVAALAGGRLARARHATEFAGRHVLITGGSRGLGLVLARRFASEGARLCLLARDEAELARAKVQLEAAQAPEVITLKCDIRRRADVRAAIDRLLQLWPAIDVLVNNAGTIQVGPIEHMTHEDFDNAMATHFWGPLHLMEECIPAMRRRGFGRIVNISSIGGRVAIPHLAPYCASKFALTGLSDAFRAELDRDGIRITTVCPGLMRTGSPRNAQVKGQHEAEYAWFAIADALPGLSISAERAAEQIVEACRYGDPELTYTLPARLAIWANALSPAATASTMMAAARLLPGPTNSEGDRLKSGRESESRWAPSLATTLSDKAAAANNQI
ncbi:MAG TPA: SDR family oxidoreductase [Vicinamibacterales bacterium]|nr:SDR family oxidoreductase [Vicinamibacterales bacterium]